jgi:RimJ/RimL family protein N-acetyltransferase
VPSIALPDPPLADPPVCLRPFRLTDIDRVYEACQDEDIGRFTATLPSPYTRADAAGWIAAQEATRRDGSALDLAIEVETIGLAGAIGLVGFDWNAGTARVGYWTAPWARGRGAATGALRLLSEYGLETLGLRSIALETALENDASQRVAVRAGYSYVGIVDDVHGKFPAVRRFRRP